MPATELSKRLTKIREERGYKRTELAEMLGIPYRTITNYETGEREPGHPYIIKIAKLFNVTTDYILGLENETGSVCRRLKMIPDYLKKYKKFPINLLTYTLIGGIIRP